MTPLSRLLALTLVLAAPRALAQEPSFGAVVPSFDPPRLKLLEPGREPRRVLLHPAKTQRAQLTTLTTGGRWATQTEAGEKAQQWPTLTFELRATPASGRFNAYQVISLKPSAAHPDGGTAALDAPTAAVLSALEGMSCHASLTPNGLVRALDCTPGPHDQKAGLGPAMELRSYYAGEMLKGMLLQLFIPFPVVPIGPGARWQTERVATRGPLRLTLVSTFALLSSAGDRVTLSVRYGAKPDPASPYRPEEIDLHSSGGGELEVDLTRPFPTSLIEQVDFGARLGGKTTPLVIHQGSVQTRALSQ